jgi:hypothetical protein
MQPRGGFGGIRDGFDLIFSSIKIANISTRSIELVFNSISRVSWAILGLLLRENEDRAKLERNTFNIILD